MENLWQFDLSVFRAINLGWRSPFADVFFLVFSYLGLGQVQCILVLAYPASVASKRPEPFWPTYRSCLKDSQFRVARLIGLVVLSGTLIAQLGKKLLPRDRPSNLPWSVTQEEWRSSSFPSGHTTTAFALGFYFLAITWGTPRAWMGWSSMVLAALVGLSRIYRGVHWPTDVLGGACAGLIAAMLMLLWENRSRDGLNPTAS